MDRAEEDFINPKAAQSKSVKMVEISVIFIQNFDFIIITFVKVCLNKHYYDPIFVESDSFEKNIYKFK